MFIVKLKSVVVFSKYEMGTYFDTEGAPWKVKMTTIYNILEWRE